MYDFDIYDDSNWKAIEHQAENFECLHDAISQNRYNSPQNNAEFATGMCAVISMCKG